MPDKKKEGRSGKPNPSQIKKNIKIKIANSHELDNAFKHGRSIAEQYSHSACKTTHINVIGCYMIAYQNRSLAYLEAFMDGFSSHLTYWWG